MILYKKNDSYLELKNLKDEITGEILANATVVATLRNKKGEPVAQVSNLSLSAVDGSPGTYRGAVEDTFDPKPGKYILYLEAVEAGKKYYIEREVEVRVRTA